MGDQVDEPLPPGVESLPSSSSSRNSSSLVAAGSGSRLFPLPLSNGPGSSSLGAIDPQYICASKVSHLQPISPSSQNIRADVSELAILQPHDKSNGSSEQFESSHDVEAAAQNAVLHEQVFPFILCFISYYVYTCLVIYYYLTSLLHSRKLPPKSLYRATGLC